MFYEYVLLYFSSGKINRMYYSTVLYTVPESTVGTVSFLGTEQP